MYTADNLKRMKQLKYHTLEAVEIIEQDHYSQPGRPAKQTRPTHKTYHIQATLVVNETVLEQQRQQAGRFILATNVLDKEQLNNDAVLSEYKEQQSTERGFSFLKDPLFFADSVFLKDPGRIAAVGMVMGLCLLVYNLGQAALRQALVQADESLPNQLKKPTQRPTLRWIFQCFQAVHLLVIDGVEQIANLTDERLKILRFFSQACRDYYLLC
uniref:IS1634 family transposase n=1 Tax=Allocoleopsis franciscana TaxID=2886352 RepID=UPI0002DE29F9